MCNVCIYVHIIYKHPRNRVRCVAHPPSAYSPSLCTVRIYIYVHIGFEDCIFHGPMKTSLNTSLTIVYIYIYTHNMQCACTYTPHPHAYTHVRAARI